MKGIIFNLLEQFIVENFGEDKYEEILSGCELRTREPFVGPGSYPDEDFFALVNKTVEATGLEPAAALQSFGRFCFPLLAERFPEFVRPHNHPKPFLKSVESVVHTEVKKLYEGADPPGFVCEEPPRGGLIIRYRSGRRLCRFMEGLIEGVAEFYSSSIRYEQRACMLDGAESCEFVLAFAPEKDNVHENGNT